MVKHEFSIFNSYIISLLFIDWKMFQSMFLFNERKWTSVDERSLYIFFWESIESIDFDQIYSFAALRQVQFKIPSIKDYDDYYTRFISGNYWLALLSLTFKMPLNFFSWILLLCRCFEAWKFLDNYLNGCNSFFVCFQITPLIALQRRGVQTNFEYVNIELMPNFPHSCTEFLHLILQTCNVTVDKH